ncbi:MAG TPA: TonB-dependent receptor [Caulobacteraceae bacterium]|nr:TonB-dependent receptor [Caulobacteraceae bacterium]
MRARRKAWFFGISLIPLALVSAAQAAPADTPGGPLANSSTDIGEVVVTATRREETINKVPESITAFTSSRLESLEIKTFADIVQYTPGIEYSSDSHDISIRGIESTAGSSTTGIYIDDTPIQVRNLGLNANSTLPVVFDLNRVEVLRGPQGTLFGAGSEGGTIRYITNQPSLTTYSGMAHAEVAWTQDGAPSYEGGVAVGGPIVQDKLGFRISAWSRRDGGYVDWVNDQTLQPIEKNANRIDTYVVRAAVTWAPVSNLTITPSVDWQVRDQNQQDEYWVSISNPSSGSYLNATPDRQPDNDHFVLPAVRVEWDAGPVNVISNTSYYDRRERVSGYSGTLYNLSYFQHYLTSDPALSIFGYPSDPQGTPCANNCQGLYPLLTATGPNIAQDPGLAGYQASNTITNAQQNFTEEVRVVSAEKNSRLQWTAGFFFSYDRQQSNEQIFDPQLPQLTQYLWAEDMLTAWGEDLLPGGVDYDNNTRARDRQEAIFADATYAFTKRLKLEIGLRYAWTNFRFINSNDGPQDLLDNGGVPAIATGAQSDHPFTPKASLTYQLTQEDMVYFTAAKGFRIGGATPPLPVQACGPGFPDSYNSDSVWNYEVGTKDSFLQHTLSVQASLYYITWSNIQQAFYVPSCGIQFTTNAGDAVSKGFDFQSQWQATRHLIFDLAVGYTDAYFTKTALDANGDVLDIKGDNIVSDSGPWTVSLGAQYNFQAFGRDAFVRLDDSFNSRRTRPIPTEDPNTAFYDPGLRPNPPVNQLFARAGITIQRWDFAVYANNLADAHPQLNLQHEDAATLLYEAETLRPRTVGMSANYHF